MKTVIWRCAVCSKDNVHTFTPACAQQPGDMCCKGCSHTWSWGVASLDAFLFEQCPICACKAFYVQKSIHPYLMWGGLVLAVLLVPKTYGLSLPVLWLVDKAIEKKIPNLLVCYRCRAAFRGFNIPERFKEFQHHIAAKHEENYFNK